MSVTITEQMFAAVSDHPVDVGQRSEGAITAELVKRGVRVLLPLGHHHRYDLVVDDDGRFLRVQCKTGRLRDGCVVFAVHSVRSNARGAARRSYAGEVELFAVYCAELDRVYLVPVAEVVAGGEMRLRVEPPRNGQRTGVRWARQYELPA